MTVSNPFDEWQIGFLPDGAAFPVPVIVQAALSGTVDDGGITDHADGLFESLTDRGRDAWNEAALLLVQYLISAGSYGSGGDAALRYTEQIPDGLPKPVESMHVAVAAWILDGKEGCERTVGEFDDEQAQGATRSLFCLAVGASGLPRERLNSLLDKIVGSPA